MIRRLLPSLFVAAVLALAPVSTEAALITQCADGTPPCGVIGTFSWDAGFTIPGEPPDEPIVVPDLFTLVSSVEIEFTNVVLTLNATGFTLPNVTFSSGWQTNSDGTPDLPGVITSAAISFSVMGRTFYAPYPGLVPLDGPGAPVDIYAVVPVPEPASLALLSIGLGVIAARRRSVSRPRTT